MPSIRRSTRRSASGNNSAQEENKEDDDVRVSSETVNNGDKNRDNELRDSSSEEENDAEERKPRKRDRSPESSPKEEDKQDASTAAIAALETGKILRKKRRHQDDAPLSLLEGTGLVKEAPKRVSAGPSSRQFQRRNVSSSSTGPNTTPPPQYQQSKNSPTYQAAAESFRRDHPAGLMDRRNPHEAVNYNQQPQDTSSGQPFPFPSEAPCPARQVSRKEQEIQERLLNHLNLLCQETRSTVSLSKKNPEDPLRETTTSAKPPPIDLFGGFLPDSPLDFFDTDPSGAIVLPRNQNPIFPEDFPGGINPHPLSWWGVTEPKQGRGKFRPSFGRADRGVSIPHPQQRH